MEKKILIGTVTIDRDVVMFNSQFQYAASFEEIKVTAGTYPIFAYEGDLTITENGLTLGWRNYMRFDGIVKRGNVGNKIGDRSHYSPMCYNYELAQYFVDGFKYQDFARLDFILDDAFEIKVSDINSPLTGKRMFSLKICLKENAQPKYI